MTKPASLVLSGSWDLWQLYWCLPPWCLSSLGICLRRLILRLCRILMIILWWPMMMCSVFKKDSSLVLYLKCFGCFHNDSSFQLIDMWLLFFIISTTINICIHIIVDWLRKEELEKKRQSESTQVRPMTVTVSPSWWCCWRLRILRLPPTDALYAKVRQYRTLSQLFQISTRPSISVTSVT